MKNKWICIPAAAAAVCLILSFFVNDMGTLIDYILNGCMMFFLGVCLLLTGILPSSKSGRRNKKYMLMGILLGCVFLFWGGKSLVEAGMDTVQGSVDIQLNNCTVDEQTSIRRMYHSYYLKGITPYGENERFKIDSDTYYRYYGQRDFSVRISCWEHSGVVKEIY